MEGEGEHQIMKMQIEQRETKMWKGGRKQLREEVERKLVERV